MQTALDLIGIFAFEISGALMAIRLDFDVVGIAILAVITALVRRDYELYAFPPSRALSPSRSPGSSTPTSRSSGPSLPPPCSASAASHFTGTGTGRAP